jgi:hypothetical protein
MAALSKDFDFSISEEEIQTREVVVGSRKVSTSKWYKPWSWGDEKTVDVIGNEEYIDLGEFWLKHAIRLELQFRSLENAAINKIENGHGQLVDRMLGFMNYEFDKKFEALLKTVKEKIAAGKSKEEDIIKTKKLLEDISLINNKLNAIISMEHEHDR